MTSKIRPTIKVPDTVFVPIASQLNYFQAEGGSNALPNSIFGLYRASPRQPKRVLSIVTDFAGNYLPYCADGTTLPFSKVNLPVWSVYYEIPAQLPIIPLLWYFNSVLTPFRKKREIVLIYQSGEYEIYVSTRTGIVQSNLELFFDETPLQFKKSVLRPKGKSSDWWEP